MTNIDEPSQEKLFPETIWARHPEPKTVRSWVGRFDVLQYCLNDALSPRFDTPHIAASAHRALGELILSMPAEAREIRRVHDYATEHDLEV